MSKIHIWAGTLASENELRNYLDQSDSLKAWADYDNEPATGDPTKDAEPSPELRCDFCKENDLDDYDPDVLTYCFTLDGLSIPKVASAIQADASQLYNLVNESGIGDFNALIAYDDQHLSPKLQHSTPVKMSYLGFLTNETTIKNGCFPKHYLWAGEAKLTKNAVLKITGLTTDQIIDIQCYYSKNKRLLDEIIILEVTDIDMAERFILVADAGNLAKESNSMLLITLKANVNLDGTEVAKLLGMDFIGFLEHS